MMGYPGQAQSSASRQGKRIAVVGTGANGAAFGADMTRAGLDVTFIEQWPAHVEAMRANGIRVEMPDGTEVTKVKAFHLCEVATMREPFDIVLIVVKAYDTRWACELIKPLLRPDALVVGMQNGMTMDDIASIVGPERTLGAVIEIAANMFEPGIVDRQTAPSGTWFGIGAYDEKTRGREAELADVLRHCGTVEISDDIRSAKWMKLVVNASEFLPSAILNLPLAEAIKIPGIHEVMRASGREAVRTALALGHQLVPILGKARVEANDPDQYANQLLDTVLTGWTRPNTRVTVLQDWMKERRAEVDDINGLVVKEQARLGGAAPINAGLVDIAHRIERGELKADPSNAGMLTALLRQ
ncbi:MAG TPA: ketopantoate reductase family protein [Bauldia sp.]|nr:ketopantoate reductase family protein [Bauldia sp.]